MRTSGRRRRGPSGRAGAATPSPRSRGRRMTRRPWCGARWAGRWARSRVSGAPGSGRGFGPGSGDLLTRSRPRGSGQLDVRRHRPGDRPVGGQRRGPTPQLPLVQPERDPDVVREAAGFLARNRPYEPAAEQVVAPGRPGDAALQRRCLAFMVPSGSETGFQPDAPSILAEDAQLPFGTRRLNELLGNKRRQQLIAPRRVVTAIVDIDLLFFGIEDVYGAHDIQPGLPE